MFWRGKGKFGVLLFNENIEGIIKTINKYINKYRLAPIAVL